MVEVLVAYMSYISPFLVLTVIPGVFAQSTSAVSIQAASDYKYLRPCAQAILYGTLYDSDIQNYLNCGNPILNGCYCRPDFSSEVSVFISTQISQDCSPPPYTDDLTSAESIYSNYCATAMGLAATQTSAQAPTSAATPGASTTVVSNTQVAGTSTTVVVSTATSTSDSDAISSAPMISKWLPLFLVAGQIAVLF